MVVISSAVTFPINFLIAFLFKKSNRRNHLISRVGDAVSRMFLAQETKSGTHFEQSLTQQSVNINSHSWEEQGYKDSPPPEDVPPSTEDSAGSLEESATTTVKKVFRLPWWCSIIGWVLLWITVAVSVAFVTFYAITFEDEKSRKWLTSLLLSFFSSVLLTQPVKIIFFALIYALILRKPIEEPVDEEALEAEDPILRAYGFRHHTSLTAGAYNRREGAIIFQYV